MFTDLASEPELRNSVANSRKTDQLEYTRITRETAAD
jgi:hypothetical protein